MNIRQMLQEVQVALLTPQDRQVTCGEFHAALIGVIRTINSEVEKPNEMFTLAVNPYDNRPIATLLEYSIVDDPDPEIGFGGIQAVMEVDALENSITMPQTWNKLLAVYDRRGNKMRAVPFDTLMYENDSNDYTSVHNKIFFNLNVLSSNFKVTLRLRRDYEIPDMGDIEYTGMPESAYQLVLTGCILSLLRRPRYLNQDLIAVYEQQFTKLMREFSLRNVRMERHTAQRMRNTWNPGRIDRR